MHDVFDEYKIVFLEETQEHLSELNNDLIALERNNGSVELIDRIFRVLHTLKSSAAAVGFDQLSQFAHLAEDLVQQIRNRQKKASPDIVNLLFHVFDNIQNYLQNPVDQFDPFKETIRRLKSQGCKSRIHTAHAASNTASQPIDSLPEQVAGFLKQRGNKKKKVVRISIQIDPAEPIKWLRAELIINHASRLGKILFIQPEKSSFQTQSFNGLFSIFLSTDQPDEKIKTRITTDLMQIQSFISLTHSDEKTTAPVRQIQSTENGESLQGKPLISNNTIRVPVKKLDNIMHLVGELVVANSALRILERRIQQVHTDDDISHDMNLIVEQFAKLTNSLQSRVLKTRMVPIRTIFNQFNRVVRDLSMKESKEIDLIVRGEETELDKKVIDVIGDPLTHLIRNAVDHGIETPAERKAKGKSDHGTIYLSAAQTGNHIVISIRDDGRGLDMNKIRNKAVSSGLVKKDAADQLPDSEILNVIFKPGFSTADRVSAVSGRGIGLDVVNNVINSMNGSVQIETNPDQGSEFIIHLPLTLAISTVIVVEAGRSHYGIPINDIRETIKIPAGTFRTNRACHTLNWANRLIPVLRLDYIMDGDRQHLPADSHGNVSVIVVSFRDRELGLIVNQIVGKQEIVMKPLEEHYRAVRGLSGAAILGDGTVILITDVFGIMQIVRDIEERAVMSAN
jgi:two-component system chemotaxis sensor kinase CheA